MKQVPFVFFGTGDIAVHVLDALAEKGLLPAHIITSPDRPAGRGNTLTPPKVKAWALEHSIPFSQPEKLSVEIFAAIPEAQNLLVVADYGKLISKSILGLPKHGALNMHPSLLPRLRGPSPIRSAILHDEKAFGVSVMLLDEEMDHGPIVAQKEVAVQNFPPRGRELDALLSREGGALLADTIPQWVQGEIRSKEQDHASATYTKKLLKDEAEIMLGDDARANFLKIRAFDDNPRPYFFATRGDKRIRVVITDAHLEKDTLVLDRVIPEGKREMSFEEFLRSGARLL